MSIFEEYGQFANPQILVPMKTSKIIKLQTFITMNIYTITVYPWRSIKGCRINTLYREQNCQNCLSPSEKGVYSIKKVFAPRRRNFFPHIFFSHRLGFFSEVG